MDCFRSPCRNTSPRVGKNTRHHVLVGTLLRVFTFWFQGLAAYTFRAQQPVIRNSTASNEPGAALSGNGASTGTVCLRGEILMSRIALLLFAEGRVGCEPPKGGHRLVACGPSSPQAT